MVSSSPTRFDVAPPTGVIALEDEFPQDQKTLDWIRAVLVEGPTGDGQDPIEGKAARFADEVRQQAAANEALGSEGHPNFFASFWGTLLEIVQEIPPEHWWQDVLVRTVYILTVEKPLEWDNICWFCIELYEYFQSDCTSGYDVPPDAGACASWKRGNSFVARLTAYEDGRMVGAGVVNVAFAFWILRHYLEGDVARTAGAAESGQLGAATRTETERQCTGLVAPLDPEPRGAVLECRLWVAREWIVRSGPWLLGCLNQKYEYAQKRECDADDTRVAWHHRGILAQVKGISDFGATRWDFWKNRLLEFADHAEADGLGLEKPVRVAKELKEVVQRMCEIEQPEDKELVFGN